MTGITKDAKEALRKALYDANTEGRGVIVDRMDAALDSLPVLPEPQPGEAEAALAFPPNADPSDGSMPDWYVELWDAVNDYRFESNLIRREKAVVRVDNAVASIIRAALRAAAAVQEQPSAEVEEAPIGEDEREFTPLEALDHITIGRGDWAAVAIVRSALRAADTVPSAAAVPGEVALTELLNISREYDAEHRARHRRTIDDLETTVRAALRAAAAAPDAVLTFAALRTANLARLPEFGHGCDEWSETDWATAMAGECGEACNLIKKRRRGDAIAADDVGRELADVVIYADLLAARMRLDLGEWVVRKFNEVTERRGLSTALPPLPEKEGGS